MNPTVMSSEEQYAGSTGPAERLIVMSAAARELQRLSRIPLMRRRHFHQRLSDTNLFGILFWNRNGEITGANDAFLEMLGYAPDDSSKGIAWAALTPEEYRERERIAFREVAEKGAAKPFEKEFIHKNGTRISVLVGLAAFDDEPDKGASYVLDTSRYKRRVDEQRVLADLSQRAMQEDLNPFLQFAARAIQGVLHVDGCRIFLRGDEGLTVCAGQPSRGAGPDLEPASHIAVAIAGEETLGLLEVYSLARQESSDEQEEEVFLQAAANVISAAVGHKRANEALASKEQQFAERLRLESLGRLAGGIAHDFNNLLTAILGYADLAAASHPEDRSEVDEICRAANSAAELVRQLLAFSGRQTLQTKRIDLCATVCTLERMLRRLIGERIEFICRPLSDPLFVAGDPTQIEQIVMNLVLNARDAIKDDGTIVLSVAAVNVTNTDPLVRAGLKPGHYATITIADTGEGMDEATRIRIFEPFFTTKSLGKGTGLGLATVHGIVKQSGGCINVRSEVGYGSVFTVHLPLDEKADAKIPIACEGPIEGQETVLLVDDDPGVRGSLALSLPTLGYHVIAAATPAEAIGVASSQKRGIHALLTDVVMPSMSGIALSHRIREIVPDIQTLFMTGYSERVLVDTGLRADRLISKPFTPHQVASRLRQVLDGAIAAKPAQSIEGENQ